MNAQPARPQTLREIEMEVEAEGREWTRQRLQQQLLAEIAGLKEPRGPAGQVVVREQNYLASHAGRMNYRTLHRRGWPIGSGAIESACRQRQCRFKRPGQFWTPEGMPPPWFTD